MKQKLESCIGKPIAIIYSNNIMLRTLISVSHDKDGQELYATYKDMNGNKTIDTELCFTTMESAIKELNRINE